MNDFWAETCSKDEKHILRKHWLRCNNRPFCPRCAKLYALEKARELYAWLAENIVKHCRFKVYMLQIVPTLPHELDGISDSALKDAFHELMKSYRSENEEGTYLEVVQNQSSFNPFLPHKHLHALTLNISLFTDKNGRMYLRRRRPYYELEELRETWKLILQNRFHFKGEEVDIHVEYQDFFKGKGKILHWLAYMYRYEAWDVFKYLIREGKASNEAVLSRVAGDPPVYVQSMTLGQVLRSKGKVAWTGFLANSRRKKTLQAFTHEPKTVRSIVVMLREARSKCPICKSRMIRVLNEHKQAELDAQFTEENDWGDLEVEYEEPDWEKLEDDWKRKDAYHEELSEKARLARVNNW